MRGAVRAEALVAVAVAAGVVLLGPPVGLLWAALAPRAKVLPSPTGPTFRNVEGEDFVAADGTLFLLGLAAGVVAGLLVLHLRRRRTPGVLMGLVLGAGIAAVLAARIGALTDDRDATLAALRDPAGTAELDFPLQLRSRAALLGWPVGAAVTYAALGGRVGRPRAQLGETGPRVSSDAGAERST